jgi:site-specific recombinase XerD
MVRASTFGILFYIRKDKTRANETVPIFLRITIDGKRAALSTRRYIHPDKWNEKAQKAKGNGEEAQTINYALDDWKKRALQARDTLLNDDEIVTATAIKNVLDGNYKKQHTLLEAFEKYIAYIKSLKKKKYAPSTIVRYETTKSHVSDFLEHQYQLNDIRLRKLTIEFVRNLEVYFLTVKKCNQNTSYKYIKNLKAVVNNAIMKGWLNKDPFFGYKIELEEVKRDQLTQEELDAIEGLDIDIKRLDLVRDLFVFSCYTGLAYVDLAKLTAENIKLGIEGIKLIKIPREKTGVESVIPLLPQAERIIDKYKDIPEDVKKGRLLPVLSNQKLNAYLKEIADLAEIGKNLTFHLARHTFATTITLSNDVPIETVSRMLGHKRISTTQIYGKITDKKVSKDMAALRNKLDKDNENKSKNHGT